MPAPRIPPLADDELSDAARAVLAPMLDEDRAWNVFRTMAQHPDLARRWMVFANHILGKSTLPARERELAILRIGWLCGSQYEWAQHVVIGTDAGLTTDDIDRIGTGAGADGWSDLDRLILTAADELHHDHRIGDATWAALAEHWSAQQLMDLVFTVGQYTLVSMALRTFEVPLDDFLTGPEVLGAWDRRG
jgi:alkylhydroperoxidase family enzyme